MTKEIDLFSTKTESTAQTSTSTNAPKKEGASLFDSMLSTATKETKQESKTSVQGKQEPASSQPSTKDEVAVNTTKEVQSTGSEKLADKTDSTKETTTQKNSQATDVNSKNSNQTVQKEVVKEGIESVIKTKEPTSLLDKMIMEAKGVIKNKEESKETPIAKTKVTEEKDSNKKANQSEVKEEVSVLKNIVKETVLDESANTKTDDKKVDTVDVKVKANAVPSPELSQKVKVTQSPEQLAKTQEVVPPLVTTQTPESKILKSTEIKDIKNEGKTTTTVEPKTTKETVADVTTAKKSILSNGEKMVDTSVEVKKETQQTEVKIVEPKTIVEKSEIPASTVKNDSLKEQKTDLKEFVSKVSTSTQPLTTATETKNEKVAQELAKVQSAQTPTPSTVNVSKEELSTKQTKSEVSLMDKLMNSTQKTVEKKEEVIVSSGEKTTKVIESVKTATSSTDMMTSIYLSSQKKTITDKSIEVKHEAKEVVSKGTSTKDIEKGAKILDLGYRNAQLDVDAQVVKQEQQSTKSALLDKLAFVKNNMNDELEKVMTQSMTSKSNNAIEFDSKVLQVSATPVAVQTIQSRIIGARQQMSSMMSDVARTMYENYKPPVTAFRINLNPSTLGSIAIVMKSDQKNSVSISLNVSNSATLESFIDNQSTLRSALNRNFDQETNFTLDFSMQEQNSNNGSNQSQYKDEHNNAQGTFVSTEGESIDDEPTGVESNYM